MIDRNKHPVAGPASCSAARRVIAIAVLACILAPTAFAADSGTLCIGKVSEAAAGEKSLANYKASSSTFEFSIRVGDRSPVASSHTGSVLVSGLDTIRPNRVIIRRNGKAFSAFTLKFASYKSNDVCLWFGPLYESWSVWPMSQARGKCSCAKPNAAASDIAPGNRQE